jgi:hypothetical protein
MRRATVTAGLTRALAGGAVVAVPAAPPPLLTARPNPVHVGDTVTIRGREWPVIEFCSRRVRLRLESDQNAVLIGFARIRDNGRFTRRLTPEAGRIGPGRWRVVARLRCESGSDGSPNFITRRVALRIRRRAATAARPAARAPRPRPPRR